MVIRMKAFRERKVAVDLRRSIGGFVSFVLVRHDGSGVGIPMTMRIKSAIEAVR